MRWPPSTRNTVVVLAVVATALLLGPAAWIAHLKTTTFQVEATVIDQKRHVTSSAETCHPTIRYDVEGQRFEHYFEWSKACCEIGDPMTVYVDRDELDAPYGSQSYQNVPIGLMALGLVVALLAVRKVHHLRKHGPYLAAIGDVKPAETSWLVKGTARRGDLLDAPIVGEPCIAYHVVVIALAKNERHELLDIAGSRPFDLEDDSATIHVDATKGTIVRLEKKSVLNDSYDVPDGLAALLKERGLESYLERPMHWHWRVELLEDGEAVQVVGHCERRDEGQLQLTKKADGPFCISNEHAWLA